MLTGNVPNLEYSSVALQYYLRCLHYTTSRNHNDNKVKRAQSIGCDTLSRIVIHDSNMPSLFLTIEQKGSKKSSGVASAKPWIGNQDLFSVYLTYLTYCILSPPVTCSRRSISRSSESTAHRQARCHKAQESGPWFSPSRKLSAARPSP